MDDNGLRADAAEILHPVCVRIWHWANAALFVALAVTGFSLHFGGSSGAIVPFGWARVIHNASGWAFAAGYVAYVAGLAKSGEWRQYLVFRPGFAAALATQARYYARDIFRGAPHPEEPTRERKFNALQQATYLGLVAVAFPLVVVTGIMLQFPATAPERVLGGGGIWPVAVIHTVMAYLLVAFLIGHIYLATIGADPLANIRAMITGRLTIRTTIPGDGEGVAR